ncbi:MAG: ABC transporter permease [Paenirhodobacter sp.]
MIAIGLASLPRRLWISAAMVLSIALVVCVLIGFLSMAKGFETATVGAGSASVAVILGNGTNQESNSTIPGDVVRAMRASQEDFGVERDAQGQLMLSRELVVPVDLPRAANGAPQTLALRGMDQTGPALRRNAHITAGRLFSPGARELVVGARLSHDYKGLSLGDKVSIGGVDWTVVGQFTANGSAFESEIWGDLDAVQSAFDAQGRIQSLRVALTSPAGLQALQDALPRFSQMPLVARSEIALFAAQSERTGALIRMFGWPLAILMATGAIAGALNTMMTSVADRSTELATVRTLGFSRLAAFFGTCGEAIVLSAIGAIVGMLASWLIFNGFHASTLGGGQTQTGFDLRVNGSVLLAGGALGLAVGIIGGGIAAFSATRISLAQALRASL